MSHRILVISHMYPNRVNPQSGIFVHNQIKALGRAGVEVRVVSPTPFFPFYPKWSQYPKKFTSEIVNGIHTYYMPTFLLPGGLLFSLHGEQYQRNLREMIGMIRQEFVFDLIHCHTIFPDGYAGALLKKQFQVPVISTIHGSDIMLYPYRSKRVYHKTIEALNQNDQVITVSRRLEEEALRLAPDANVKTIYNGFDHMHFKPVETAIARENVGYPGKDKRIVYVGNLLPVKGVEYLLQAFQTLEPRKNGYHLYLVGEGPLRSKLMDQVKALGIEANTTFVGRKPYQDIPMWINSADIMVLSSLSEGLPSILLESMGCGKPMIATDVGGIKEVLQDGKTGYLVESKNPNQLAARLRDALQNRENKLKHMEEASYALSHQFSWQQNSQLIIQAYNRQIKKK
ncbi:glycosyltransferase family 4 protein [Hazenella sp. IB182357]|uniref:Glycosyltransferase family 4 protein n=1 Tax=Polycladospora coralii TaxID=2771432 RepID=A0A926NAR2_9BACL|nr:glycosyltransferase family 4 protein [Polycladospora coralii]MBD1372175.1 glycosyltransferase family 4 protein [Polycladospora coralii]